LKNKTKILFVPFVRHIELQNFLIAPRIYAVAYDMLELLKKTRLDATISSMKQSRP